MEQLIMPFRVCGYELVPQLGIIFTRDWKMVRQIGFANGMGGIWNGKVSDGTRK